jgi:hypothetical protein
MDTAKLWQSETFGGSYETKSHRYQGVTDPLDDVERSLIRGCLVKPDRLDRQTRLFMP